MKIIRLSDEKVIAICPHLIILAEDAEDNDSSKYTEILTIICKECGKQYEFEVWIG